MRFKLTSEDKILVTALFTILFIVMVLVGLMGVADAAELNQSIENVSIENFSLLNQPLTVGVSPNLLSSVPVLTSSAPVLMSSPVPSG